MHARHSLVFPILVASLASNELKCMIISHIGPEALSAFRVAKLAIEAQSRNFSLLNAPMIMLQASHLRLISSTGLGFYRWHGT